MLDRIEAASVSELEKTLDSLFENPTRIPLGSNPDVFFGHDSVTGHLFVTDASYPARRLMILRALVAQAKFRNEAPGWPALPLRADEIEAMIDDECIRCNVTGYYADSLSAVGWRPEHPGFRPFVGGLMFDRNTPVEIRDNPELLQQFPPVKLQGICDGRLTWRSPETLALNRKMRRMCAAHEAREAAQAARP